MPKPPEFQKIEGLCEQIGRLRDRVAQLEIEAASAKQEALITHEQILNLRDVIVAAERDQQDLKTARAKLSRLGVRSLLARILNRS